MIDEALRAAGADTSGNANYIFGQAIGLATIMAGDVLQFEGVTFAGINPANGGNYRQDLPHHTAIVYAVEGTKITLINQNVNGDRTVQLTTIDLADLQGGDIFAYRPRLA